MKKFFKTIKNFIKETDKVLLLLCMLTSAFGCTAVLSATRWSAAEGTSLTRDFIVMVAAVCAGLVISLIISFIDYEFIIKMAPLVGFVCIAMMLLLFVIGVGPVERPDAKTWIKFGPIFFQPSEIVKIGFILIKSVTI